MIPLLFGLFGLCVGSFLNVVILRRGKKGAGSWRSGRSACPSCGSQLRWFDMVPVFSYLALRGRCAHCGKLISVQYPLVEAATAALFAAVGGAGLAMLPTLLALISAALLVCIFVYDLRHTIIPDPWVLGFNACALALGLLAMQPGWGLALACLAGPIAALPLYLLWAVSKGAWMGFGDVKLALGIGWLLGPLYGIVAVMFAFVLGALVSVPLVWWGKSLSGAAGGLTMKSEVPFGPFLVASMLLIWFALLYGIPVPVFSSYA